MLNDGLGKEAKQVIERLCALQRVAAEHVGFEYAADCFCKQSGFWGNDDYGETFDEGYRNDGKALEFIEQAVKEKIESEKNLGQIQEPLFVGDERRHVICICPDCLPLRIKDGER